MRQPASRGRRAVWLAAASVVGVVILTALALLLLGRMTEGEDTSHAPAGAERVAIPRADGDPLTGRLWTRHPTRVAVLLHGFAGDQSDWDTNIQPLMAALDGPVSVLTFDFRGHGDSAGENRDTGGFVTDIHSAVEFLRARGFEEIVLIGASMGGAAAIVAAAEDPSIVAVIALSAPAELGDLDARTAVRSLESPLGLAAAVDDPSAVQSLNELREDAGRPAAMAEVYPGRAHGVDLVERAAVRERMAAVIDASWDAP